jgi:tetratricopeptide (TPR) repeat protein
MAVELERAGALYRLGALDLGLGRHESSLKALEEALSIFRNLGDRLGIASSLANIAPVRGKLGQFRIAMQTFAEAYVLHRINNCDAETLAHIYNFH